MLWLNVCNCALMNFSGQRKIPAFQSRTKYTRRINKMLVTRQILRWNKYWCKFRPIHNIHQIDWMWLTARVPMWSAREKNLNFGFVGVIAVWSRFILWLLPTPFHQPILYNTLCYIILARFILYGICVLAYTVNHARKKTQKE